MSATGCRRRPGARSRRRVGSCRVLVDMHLIGLDVVIVFMVMTVLVGVAVTLVAAGLGRRDEPKLLQDCGAEHVLCRSRQRVHAGDVGRPDHEILAPLLNGGFLLLEVDLDIVLVHQGRPPCVILIAPQARVVGDIGEDLVDG